MKIDEEFKKQHGFIGPYSAKLSSIDKRDFVATFVQEQITSLPEEYITPNLVPIYDQGKVGSCVAHSSCSMFEYLNQLHNGKYSEFSKGFIYAHKEDTSTSGMQPRNALKFICNNGNVLFFDFPYNLEVPNIITQYNNSGGDNKLLPIANKHKEMLTYFQLQDRNSIKSAIYKYGYIIVAIPIREDSQVTYTFIDQDPLTKECKDYEATFEEGTGKIKGHHMVALAGWSEKRKAYFMINSWSKKWGHMGCCYLPYSFTIEEAWGASGYNIVKHETPSPIPSPTPNPTPIIKKKSENELIQMCWKLINWFLNNIVNKF